MRSTFLGFETARKGMAASQKGIDITGQNITNMNTSGYTRQRVDFVSVSAPTNARYRSVGTSNAGQGVNMGGVSQIRNPYLDARFRSEFADTGYHDKALSILDGIESVLNEVEGGLKPVFNDLLAALQDFSSKPDQVTNANIVLSSVKSVTQMIRSLSKQLDTLGEQYVFDLTVDVKNVNALMEKITDLNKSISESVANQTNPSDTTNINELLDQRNLLLDELGQYGNIRVIDQGDGTVSVEMNEHKIIDGTWHEQINLSVNADNTVDLHWQSSGQKVILESGTLKASYDLISNGKGELKGLPYYKEQLNIFAKSFADLMNQAFPTKDADGNSTGYKQIITGDLTIDASNITVSSEWLDDPSFILKDLDNAGSLDNTHILDLISKLEGKGNIPGFEGSFADFIDSYVTTLGQDKSYVSGRFDASYAIITDLENKRDAISAVSLDEEGANLMVFDKAYKATSRLMTTFDEALDVLINKTGLVGR